MLGWRDFWLLRLLQLPLRDDSCTPELPLRNKKRGELGEVTAPRPLPRFCTAGGAFCVGLPAPAPPPWRPAFTFL